MKRVTLRPRGNPSSRWSFPASSRRSTCSERVAFDNALKVRNEVGLGLNALGSWTVLFLALLSELLWGFGDEEGGGQLRTENGENRVWKGWD
ncbi:hypothetical protein Ahy_A08g038440 isoform G [Arachis hypogaea]|uniref:Uncharacterized protein n=1 Tax=Arachis hypogaea TaxID=3818 RepID=A0A445BTG8_ARAHY|nr:hypothetical protein Ahy_A08g038440 isoform G [Arachis hypogaea]